MSWKEKTMKDEIRDSLSQKQSTKAESDQENAARHGIHGPHDCGQIHHHHSHNPDSRHDDGHHLLQIEHLSIGFNSYESGKSFFKAKRKFSKIIDDLNLSVHAGEIIALIGASGSGKSVLADSILGLFENNVQVSGRIYFDGEEMNAETLPLLRGRGISFIPQSVSALDPLMKVGMQVEEMLVLKGVPKKQASFQRQNLFKRYRLDEETAQMYPHQLSGGMARRILLCCALMESPKLLIADEPTPGLDLPLAKAALADFRDFANQGGGVLLITHDIELALQVADRIAIFKDGSIVEETSVANFASAEMLRHPFSKALWHALPNHDFSCESPYEKEFEVCLQNETFCHIYESSCSEEQTETKEAPLSQRSSSC